MNVVWIPVAATTALGLQPSVPHSMTSSLHSNPAALLAMPFRKDLVIHTNAQATDSAGELVTQLGNSWQVPLVP